MITCPKCSKDNQDHYKFCLGCGAELPRDGGRKPFSPETPSRGVRVAAGAAASAPTAPPPAPAAVPQARMAPPAAPMVSPMPPPVAPAAAFGGYTPPPPAAGMFQPQAAPGPVFGAEGSGQMGAGQQGSGQQGAMQAPTTAIGSSPPPCPQCGHVNSPGHIFCGGCGFRLTPVATKGAPASVPQLPVEHPTAATLTLTALRADGSEAGTFIVQGPSMTVGRETGGIFAGDSYLSPRHATIHVVGVGRATVKDEASLNGVYRKVVRDTPVEVKPNEVFRIGQEIIRFEPMLSEPPSPDGVERLGAPTRGYVGRIALVIGRDETGNAFPIPETGIHLGRERGDILFPEDGYVSGLHCTLTWDDGRLFLTDLGSSNGTFVRVRDEFEVCSGDVLLMGQQLFRISN